VTLVIMDTLIAVFTYLPCASTRHLFQDFGALKIYV